MTRWMDESTATRERGLLRGVAKANGVKPEGVTAEMLLRAAADLLMTGDYLSRTRIKRDSLCAMAVDRSEDSEDWSRALMLGGDPTGRETAIAKTLADKALPSRFQRQLLHLGTVGLEVVKRCRHPLDGDVLDALVSYSPGSAARRAELDARHVDALLGTARRDERFTEPVLVALLKSGLRVMSAEQTRRTWTMFAEAFPEEVAQAAEFAKPKDDGEIMIPLDVLEMMRDALLAIPVEEDSILDQMIANLRGGDASEDDDPEDSDLDIVLQSIEMVREGRKGTVHPTPEEIAAARERANQPKCVAPAHGHKYGSTTWYRCPAHGRLVLPRVYRGEDPFDITDDAENLLNLADHDGLPSWVHERLAAGGNDAMRKRVVENPEASTTLIGRIASAEFASDPKRLAFDSAEARAASDPRCPVDVVVALVRDTTRKGEALRRAAARNPSLPEKEMRRVVRLRSDAAWTLYSQLVYNPSCPADVLLACYESEALDRYGRAALVGHANCPPDVIEVIRQSDDVMDVISLANQAMGSWLERRCGVNANNSDARAMLIDPSVRWWTLTRDDPRVLLALSLHPNP